MTFNPLQQDNGVFSGIIVKPWFLKTFHYPSASLLGTVSAVYNVGGFAGSTVPFFVGDAFGRRRTILTGIVVTTIWVIPFCTATGIGSLLAGRLVCGIGVGLMKSTVGIWQAETTPARTRGAYLVAQLLFGARFGLFLAQWINYGFYAGKGRAAFILGLPESPRWQMKKGRSDEALDVLIRLGGSEDAEQHLARIKEADALEKSVEGSQSSALFKNGPTQNFSRLCLACGVMIMHQLTGINSVTYYLPTLLQKFLNTSHRETLWIAGLSSVDSIVCMIVPVLTIDRLGRKPFLFHGSIFHFVMFIIIASLLGTATPESKSSGVATTVMLFIFYGGNAATWLGTFWAYPAEILPLQMREMGLALRNVCYWLFQFMFVEVTPTTIENICYKFYIILAVLNAFNAMIVWIWYPEIARKSLEELDFFFANKCGSGTEVLMSAMGKSASEVGMTTRVEDTEKGLSVR